MILTVLRFWGTSDGIRFAGIFCDDATMALVYFPTLVDPCQGVTSRGVTLFIEAFMTTMTSLTHCIACFFWTTQRQFRRFLGLRIEGDARVLSLNAYV